MFVRRYAIFVLALPLMHILFGQNVSLAATIADIKQSSKTEPALMVISYDAFRPEYFHRNVTPFMNQLAKEATRAEYMRNVFPTKTFVNHFSVATGLYPEKHGVLANSLWDNKLGKKLNYDYDMFHFNDSVLPIWTINEMNGKHSGCMMWPGSDYPYQNVSCTYTHKYNVSESWYSRIDEVITWFQHKVDPINLAMVYVEEPDRHGHAFSPDSNEMTDMIRRMDDLTKYIEKRLAETGLDKRVNVVYLSDHGMSTVTPPNFIDLNPFVENGTMFVGTSPTLQVVSNDSASDLKNFANLQKAASENGHFKVYNRDTILPRWHANNTQRMGPILAVADIGYAFHDMYDEAKWYEMEFNVTLTPTTKYGVHGYDNEDPSMHAVFMAKGPLFKAGQIIKPFNSIDLYNLFCHIVKIKCHVNDGQWDAAFWSSSLKEPVTNEESATEPVSISFWTLIVAVIIVLTVIISGTIAFYMRRRRGQETITNRSYTLSGFDRFDDAAGANGERLRTAKPVNAELSTNLHEVNEQPQVLNDSRGRS